MKKEEAKNYALRCTARHMSPAECLSRLEDYKRNNERAHDEESKSFWREQASALEDWINSDTFNKGEYAAGVDQLVLDLVEWRAIFFALENTKVEVNPFEKHEFFALWRNGGIYAIFGLLSKLMSKNKQDNSLRNLWQRVHEYIVADGFCSLDEARALKERVSRHGRISRAIAFRNKTVAHNEHSLRITWEDLDSDVELVARIWSLVTQWCSSGILFPWKSGDLVFSGLDSYYSDEEIRSLKQKRQEYIDRFSGWCTTNSITGLSGDKRSPFATLSIGFK